MRQGSNLLETKKMEICFIFEPILYPLHESTFDLIETGCYDRSCQKEFGYLGCPLETFIL